MPATPAPAPAPTPARPAVSETTRGLLLKIDGLRAEVGRLERAVGELRGEQRSTLQAAEDEREQLRYLRDEADRRARRAEHELKQARARLRKAGKAKAAPEPVAEPRFADPEEGFRYWVRTQWATRTLPAEQEQRPLPDYDLGPRFLASLDALEGIKLRKVADVVFEVVTGLAQQNPSRELHRLRCGPGGKDPVRTRSEDGATAYRVSMQVKSPAARRLHYWQLPSGRIELARVATHDDFDA